MKVWLRDVDRRSRGCQPCWGWQVVAENYEARQLCPESRLALRAKLECLEHAGG